MSLGDPLNPIPCLLMTGWASNTTWRSESSMARRIPPLRNAARMGQVDAGSGLESPKNLAPHELIRESFVALGGIVDKGLVIGYDGTTSLD